MLKLKTSPLCSQQLLHVQPTSIQRVPLLVGLLGNFHLLDSTFLQGLFGLPQSSYAASKYTARHLNGIVVTLDRPASK